MIEPLRTGVSFYNTTRDIIKGLRARMKSQASELEALQRVFSLALFQFSPPRSAAELQQHHHHQHWYGGTKYVLNQNPPTRSACLSPSVQIAPFLQYHLQIRSIARMPTVDRPTQPPAQALPPACVLSHAAPGAGVILRSGCLSLRQSSGAGCGDDTLLHQP
jgi:hypothetical protein